MKQPESEKWIRAVLGASLFLLAALVYLPSLDYPFQFDDHLFLNDGNVTQGRWLPLAWPPSSRVVAWMSFLVQRQLHGPDPAAFHGFNVLIHAGCSVLAFLLLGALFRLDEKAPRGLSLACAFLGGALFALHPLQSEPVFYIYQRSTLLAAFFGFAGLLAWIGKDPEGPSSRRAWISGVCFLLGVASKEFMAVLPLAYWSFDGFVRRRWKPRRGLALMLALCALLAGVYFVRSGVSWVYAATQVRVWWLYLFLALGLIPQHADHWVAPQTTLADSVWWLALLGLALLAGAAWKLRLHSPTASFLASLYAIFLLPSSSLAASPDFLFEHRVYASMIGLAGLAGLGFRALWRLPLGSVAGWIRRPAMAAGALLIFILCVHATGLRGRIWRDPVSLWSEAAAHSPLKYRNQFNLGAAWMEHDPARAERHLSRAVEVDPTQPLAYRSLGELKLRQGDSKAAEVFWKQALLLDPTDVGTLMALGGLDAAKRDYFSASAKFKEAARLAPRSAQPRLELSLLNLRFGFVREAIREAEAGLQHNPRDTRLLLALADAVGAENNWKRAEELYRQVLALSPENVTALYGQARALLALGRSEEALAAAQQGAHQASSSVDQEIGLQLIRRIRDELERSP